MKPKYIIIKHAGQEVPIVFPSILAHDSVAGNKEVQSAGFCARDANGNWVALGRSESLSICARPEDANILNTYL